MSTVADLARLTTSGAPSILEQMDTTVKAGAIVIALFVAAFGFLYFRIGSGPKKRR